MTLSRSIALSLLAFLAGCTGEPQTATAPAQDVPPALSSAIARYLGENVAPTYGGDGEHCIPLVRIVAVDATNPADILVWGDFEVWNYRLDGDTLQCLSGGSHPGLVHLRETGGAFVVTAFDPVLDGADSIPSAKRIFGRHFPVWQKLAADDATRDESRRITVADYVSDYSLPARFYQDYGWPPAPLFPPPSP